MHDVVVNELENHLTGSASAEFHAHLASCRDCREEVEAISGVSALFSEIRSVPDTAPVPSPFFFTRVAASIIEHEKESRWGLLSPGAAFFRRVAFASLLVLAGLGSYLAVTEGQFSGTDAATIIAAHDATTVHAESSDRDLMLVTLASYEE